MEYTASCDGNKISINMKGLMPPEMLASANGGEVTLEGNEISFPNSMTTGEKLNDGTVTMTLTMGTVKMKTIMNILNRTVLAAETITTPAGSFDCYKIEYLVETTMMGIKNSAKVVQWISKGIGTVKSENYTTNGDLMGSSVLTALQKP
jgi:type 1 fimbria pilin